MSRSFSHMALLKELSERGRLVASADALAVGKSIGGTKASVEMALARLVKSGLLTRIRRGLYVVSVPGMSPLHPFVVGSALVEDGVVSGWSALHHHGLTEQIPRVVEVTSSKRMRAGSVSGSRRIVEYEGEQFHVVTVRASLMFGIEQDWFSGAPARVFDRERAVLDLFLRPGDFGGLETALEMLDEKQRELNVEKLVHYAEKVGKVTVKKRVGWALERVGAAVELSALIEAPTKGYGLLDPSKPARGPFVSRWHLRENIERDA